MLLAIYQNRRNPHKYIEVHCYSCSHWSIAQFITTEPSTDEIYTACLRKYPPHWYTGTLRGTRFLNRWKRHSLTQLLDDYTPVFPFIHPSRKGVSY